MPAKPKRAATKSKPAGPAKRKPSAGSSKDVTGMSDEAVRAKTGKTWDQWFKVLDRAGALDMPHRDIARYLYEEQEVPGWWAQMVTVGYERARGKRDLHERPSGYSVSRTKTVGVPLAVLFQAWNDARKRSRWLGKARLQVRKATPSKSMRITWQEDGTNVEVGFLAKAPGKSQVSVQHDKLSDRARADRAKAFWGERLEQLKEMLES